MIVPSRAPVSEVPHPVTATALARSTEHMLGQRLSVRVLLDDGSVKDMTIPPSNLEAHITGASKLLSETYRTWINIAESAILSA